MTSIDGTANIFADLGLPDAADRQTKTRLAMAVNAIIKERRLKQADAAAILNIPQPKPRGGGAYLGLRA